MNEALFEPSLEDEQKYTTQSYNLSRIFYVAFFGGVVPTVALGTKNGRWLKVDERKLNLMIGLGVVILIVKAVVSSLILKEYISVNPRTIRWVFKGATLLLYLGYLRIMKSKFQQHIVLDGKIQPILKDAITWIVIGNIVEFVLVSFGGSIIQYVL